MTVNPLHTLSTEQIIAQIEEIKADGDEMVKKVCIHLVELRRRKVGHRLFHHRVYRHFDRIAAGRILPGIVSIFNGERWYIDRFAELSEVTQWAIVNGLDFTVARLNAKQDIEEGKMTVLRMSRSTINRVFPLTGGVATYSQQKTALLAEIARRVPLPPRVRADLERRVIMVGRTEVSIPEIKAALEALGFSLRAPIARREPVLEYERETLVPA